MKFIGKSYSLYTKDIHQIWCRSAKFLWKWKFCSESGSGSGSWYYFGFQYQTYISYIEDTYQILFGSAEGSANSFESYCVHMKSPRTYVHPDRQTDGNFCFLITYGVSKNRKYCNRMKEKRKKFSPFEKCSWFACLRRQNKPKKFFICLSVCLDVRTYVDFSCGHNNFWRS